MSVLVENFTQINIPKGKTVTISFDAYEHQEFEILNPQNKVICTKNSDSNTPYLFENQSFSTKVGGNYTIKILSNHIEQEVTLAESNEIFGGSEITRYYNFISSGDTEISLVVQ